MDNLKIGTELNVALDTGFIEREKSLDLNVGYDRELDEWELIIKYTGNIEEIAGRYDAVAFALLNGFGIIRIRTEYIDALSNDSSVIFVEKPKSFYEERTSIKGFSASCMDIPFYSYNLRGKGIMVAVIDSGIDIYHDAFIRNNSQATGEKTSKIFELWDQTIPGNPPYDFYQGTVFSNDDINARLNSKENSVNNLFSDTFSRDISGHGTGVAGVVTACVPEADLLIVKLDTTGNKDSNTIGIMMGIDYAVRRSIDIGIPMVINLSYGNNYGDHNGNSILEEYIDSVAASARITFCVGAGNDGNSARHMSFVMGNESWYRAEFLVSPNQRGINIQVWRSFQDVVDIFLITPSGKEIGPFNNYSDILEYRVDRMNIRVLNGFPTPINKSQETYIAIIPEDTYIESGVWSIRFNPKNIREGRVDIWLPVEGSTSSKVEFLTPTEYTSLTIPSTAKNVITVGAYNSDTLSYADFSGRGYTVNEAVKPDIVAPGVNIDVPAVGGGYKIVSGTSFATPFVSAGAAMLMEYGIVSGNDPFLYGEKLKAYLISGAGRLPGISEVPNPNTGWGYLCVEDSLGI